jgi:hypothetical protein
MPWYVNQVLLLFSDLCLSFSKRNHKAHKLCNLTCLLQISTTHYWGTASVLVHASNKKGTAPHDDKDVLLLHQLWKATVWLKYVVMLGNEILQLGP